MATESQTPKGTQFKGGWNFYAPDFNKLPYSLRSQGDKKEEGQKLWGGGGD